MNKVIQAKVSDMELQEENMGIRKKKQGDFITSEDVSKLKYTNKVCLLS